MPGSSNLTTDQQQWYQVRFGMRYVAVQERPFAYDERGRVFQSASRAERRRMRFKPKAAR